ncbi:xylose isomerase [Rhodoferax lacus]|uniref:Xylose isomerase n=1 Tax=Rhodoferax lacus TaxID=2184758 RepID=A0A3E1RBN8_9BURK|nr:TIM barrel protein [Rhodoferax lacus]RFO96641.1 xylose isomerase [Rhodoferax lacus]
MQLDLFKSLWGWQGDWSQCAAQVREMGGVGVETRMPVDAAAVQQQAQALQNEGLALISVVFTGGDVLPNQAWTPAQHLQRLQGALDSAAILQPRFINLLAGNDRWPLAQQVDFFGQAQALADAAGVVCSFETHRASSLFSPWVTLALIEQLPQLRFTADISHWVVVCERLLDAPQDDLSPFIARVHHTQARVGYDQGPQVPHPGAPEYAREVAFHYRVWQSIWASQAARGYSHTTLTPEFGPDGYTHLMPFTKAPVADLWELNLGMARTQRAQFERWLHRQKDYT